MVVCHVTECGQLQGVLPAAHDGWHQRQLTSCQTGSIIPILLLSSFPYCCPHSHSLHPHTTTHSHSLHLHTITLIPILLSSFPFPSSPILLLIPILLSSFPFSSSSYYYSHSHTVVLIPVLSLSHISRLLRSELE